jgi:succinate dehydrogenase / fumarate reductase, membrane anchor subunit
MTDRRTALARVLGYGSARDGTGHWWSQRVSAVALVFLGGWLAVSLTLLPGFGHQAVVEWIGRPWTAILMLLTVVTVAWHSHLGVQVVIEDYVQQPFAKVASLLASRFAHVLAAAAAVFAILRISFGAPA